MESFNKIEIRGIVGQASISTVAGRLLASFSVATSEIITKDVVETTWFQVVAAEAPGIEIEHLAKGVMVLVKGRVRMRCYEAADGSYRQFPEIEAKELKVEPANEEEA